MRVVLSYPLSENRPHKLSKGNFLSIILKSFVHSPYFNIVTYVFLQKSKVGAGEMTRPTKHSSYKLEDLIWDQQYLCEKSGIGIVYCNPGTGSRNMQIPGAP